MGTRRVAASIIWPDLGYLALRLAVTKGQAHIHGPVFRRGWHAPDTTGSSARPQWGKRPLYAVRDVLTRNYLQGLCQSTYVRLARQVFAKTDS